MRALLIVVALLSACTPPKGTIGAVLAQDADGELVLHEVPEGLAAHKAGLRPGDKVLTIDGMDVRALDAKGIHRALSGEPGDTVKLTLVRGEAIIRVTLKRTEARRLPLARQ